MPRVNFSVNGKNAAKRRDDLMGGEVEKWIRVSGMSKVEIGRMMGISLSTLNDRIKNPGTFQIRELRVLADLTGTEVSQLVT